MPRTDVPGQRILLVDDNEDQTSTLRTLLELAGYQVEVAADGGTALERARRFRPEIAILDIGLPDMDGNELARRIRQDPELKGIFLVAQTGWGPSDVRGPENVEGFDVRLMKPVSFDVLQDVLRQGRPPGG